MTDPKHKKPLPEVSELDLADLQPTDDGSRSVIARRIGLGLLLIVILLGGLHVAEWLESEEDEEVATSDVRNVQPRVIGQTINTGPVLPVTPGDAPPTDPASQHVPTPGLPFPVPLPTPPVAPEPPPPPAVDATPTAKLARPAPPPARPAERLTDRPVQAPSQTLSQAQSKAPPARDAVMQAPAPRPAPAPAPKPQASPPRLFNNFLVQAGVFSNPQKAQELHALLTLNGIPASLETRVKVGPFKNKAEADAAREKLKELGIDSLLLPPN